MNEMVTVDGGQAITTTLAIASGTEVDHASVIKLVRAYQSDLEEFGLLDFKSESSGGRPTEYANLNEQQATLILTYMRNNDIVREFKKRLVRAFYDMASMLRETKKIAVPTKLSEALRLAADQAEKIEQQQALIEQQKPAVEFVDKYVETTGSKGFREVCKLLKANENEFREFLISRRIMYRLGGKMVPYGQHMEAGRFDIKTGVSGEHAFSQTRFTPKGIQWIAGLWAGELVNKENQGAV